MKYANITISANVEETFIVDTMFSDKCRLLSVSCILNFIKLTRTLVSGDEMAMSSGSPAAKRRNVPMRMTT